MPVLVTAAQTPLGGAVVERLLGFGGQVRAFVTGDGPVERLRARGAIIATGDLDDEGHLEAAMEQVHTVVHLGGGILSPSADRIVVDGATVVTAAIGAEVQRLILLSVAGASPTSDEPYRRAKGEVEDLVAAAPIPSVALRCSLIDTPGMRDVVAGAHLPDVAWQNRVRPLSVELAAEVISFLDEVRSEAHEGHVVLRCEGARERTLGEYRDHVAGGSLVGRTYRPAGAHPLVADALAGPWLPAPSWPDAVELAGATRR